MTWKIELAALTGATVLAILAWGHARNAMWGETPERFESFTRQDYTSFDRDFSLDGATCHVGIEARQICFHASDLAERVEIGKTWPDVLPVAPAELPTLLRTDLKTGDLHTYRIGQALFLVEGVEGRVIGRLDLSAPSYDLAISEPDLVQTASMVSTETVSANP